MEFVQKTPPNLLRAFLEINSQAGTWPSSGAQTNTAPAPRGDTELVRDCLRRDESAWQELVVKYGRLVYSIPRRYGLSASEADDVFQNVFLIALRQLGNLKNETSLAPWLATITHRETQRIVKSQNRFVELDDALPDTSEQFVSRVERDVLIQQLYEAMQQLDPRSRAFAMALLADDRPNYEEIARRFSMPMGSIGPTRARVLKKLEAILQAKGVDLR